MNEKLKPCPFCGVEVFLNIFGDKDKCFSVECFNPNCAIQPTSPYYDTEADAIAAWNRRAADD